MVNSLTHLQLFKLLYIFLGLGSVSFIIFRIPVIISERKIDIKIFLFALLFFGATMGAFLTDDKIYSKLKTKAETEYVVYLDGQEVDPDTIEFRQYSYSLNDDKTIILTKKRSHSHIYVPISVFH